MRRYVRAALTGALVGAALMAATDALSPQASASCIETGPCPNPPLLMWSAIRPGWALVGAAGGAILGIVLHALRVREQRRRERVGA